MSKNQAESNTCLISLGAQSSVQKAGELFSSRALNALVDGMKSAYSGAQILLGTAFTRYLSNATRRYNQVKTLATGITPRPIVGANNLYVSIGVNFDGMRIDTDTIDPLLRISKNILIIGTGGIGKSMMMRYLFLDTAYRGEYVPLLLELRKIGAQAGTLSILDLIYACLSDFDVNLNREQFEYSLRLGKYLFLMDGFDEVRESLAAETAAAIQSFCSKYPENPCIITSRPRRDTTPLETFTTIESLPLDKRQAIELASKIWNSDDKTIEFCRQLHERLYEEHQDFAENPLLLSMMFLTFMRNNSVPNHLSEFYRKAYEALYSAHDSNDKGYYHREFRCKDLDEPGFKKILSHFCFQSYLKEDYDFTREELVEYIEKSIKKMGYNDISASDYLEDLRNVVCLVIEDGDIYRFSHRSFQTYFAAWYTSNNLTDEQQQKLFDHLLSSDEVFWKNDDYYDLLAQIEPQRFTINALEKKLREIQSEVGQQSSPIIYFHKLQYGGLHVDNKEELRLRQGLSFIVRLDNGNRLNYNTIGLFRRYVNPNYSQGNESEWIYIRNCVEKVKDIRRRRFEVTYSELDTVKALTDREREILYAELTKVNNDHDTLHAIEHWLKDIDAKREVLSTSNFIDNL